jgi:hypothetical protein
MSKMTTKASPQKAKRTKTSPSPRVSPKPPSKLKSRPKLLSGGNPQIPIADGDAPVQTYIAAMPGWKSDVGRRLDSLITKAVPDVRKAVKWNSPFYGVEGQGWFLSFHCFTKYIKVAFFKGAALGPGLTGTAKSGETRYLDIYEQTPGTKFDESQFVVWVKQASKLPGWMASSGS